MHKTIKLCAKGKGNFTLKLNWHKNGPERQNEEKRCKYGEPGDGGL